MEQVGEARGGWRFGQPEEGGASVTQSGLGLKSLQRPLDVDRINIGQEAERSALGGLRALRVEPLRIGG